MWEVESRSSLGFDSALAAAWVPSWAEISLEETWNIVGGPGDARQVWVRVPRKLPHR